MKTNFTFLLIVAFLFVGMNVSAKRLNSDLRKNPFSLQKKSMVTKQTNVTTMMRQFIADNQMSVPGNSEDYSWDEETGSWFHYSNTTYTYDEVGSLLEEIVQEAETNNYLTRESQSYDSHRNLTEEISYMMINEEWVILTGSKYQYTYDDNGNIKEEIDQTWQNGDWMNDSKITHTLNVSGEPVEITIYSWNGIGWTEENKTINIVWHNLQKQQVASYTFQSFADGLWVNSERYSSVFDGENYTATTQIWDNDAWINAIRNTYTKTSADETVITESWESSQWVNAEKFVTSIDSHGNITAYRYNEWRNEDWSPMVEYYFDLTYSDMNDFTQMVIRYWETGLSAPANLMKYVFSNFLYFPVTGIDDLNALNDVKVFPNPVGKSFTIQVNDPDITNYQVDLVNLSGQTVFSKNISGFSASVNTGDFVRGIYILNIKTANGKSHSLKLIKE